MNGFFSVNLVLSILLYNIGIILLYVFPHKYVKSRVSQLKNYSFTNFINLISPDLGQNRICEQLFFF